MKIEIEFDTVADLSEKLHALLIDLHPGAEQQLKVWSFLGDTRPIQSLNLDTRTTNVLLAEKILTVRDLMMRRGSLQAIPNLVRKSSIAIVEALSRLVGERVDPISGCIIQG